jgi:uncharacterized protein YicC (UPF0701 family)
VNKVPQFCDDAAHGESDISLLSRRRHVRDLAKCIARLKAFIRHIHPDIDLPAYGISEIEGALPDVLDAKLAEGKQLVGALQATLDRLRRETADARHAAMSSIERLLQAENDELRGRVERLEAAIGIARGEVLLEDNGHPTGDGAQI